MPAEQEHPDFERAARTAAIWAKSGFLAPWPNADTETFRNIGRAVLALHAELQAAQEREADIHTALAESNVPRSAGVDEPLYSDAYRVRLLVAELRLAQENIRVREESQIPVIPRGAQAKMDRFESELRAAQERERALREIVAKHEKVCSDCDGAGYLQDGECDWCGASGFVCDDLALAWADVRSLAAQRTEEPSDDEGLEPIETSPLTEREPDL